MMSLKQKSLKRIGKFRHLAFDRLLYEHFIKEKWFLDPILKRPIIRDYVVFDISAEGIDAVVFDRKTMKPLKVYELTNYCMHAPIHTIVLVVLATIAR